MKVIEWLWILPAIQNVWAFAFGLILLGVWLWKTRRDNVP